MKNFVIFALLALGVTSQGLAAGRLTDTEVRDTLNYTPLNSRGRLGTQLEDRKLQVLQCRYDFAVDGGAVSTITLRDAITAHSPCSLPNGAVIWQVAIDVITAFSSTGNNGTIALQANAAGDLLATVDADTLPVGGSTHLQAGIPVGTAATMIKATAARDIKMVIATNAMLTGKANIFILYFYSST